ncbi:MAG TPA: AbrB/MazE/SpoVT family DNA-binding domain-containing protein [Verrucomicrobiales bacterium]|nr:AbrB/MazE/SpoVT family DNA-binding domain-containing protein [Verrucomicrobiales bacterium]
MIAKSKVSGKNQVTVPVAVMKILGMSPGDTVVFQSEGGQVILRAKNRRMVEWARQLPGTGRKKALTVDAMRDAVESGAAKGEDA